MRYLVLSDLHANLEALTAVLAAAAEEPFEKVLLLGDLVGYGASPDEVVAAVRRIEVSVLAVRGNHDRLVAGHGEPSRFRREAQRAAHWTARRMAADRRAWLAALPPGPLAVEGDDLVICHGSPLDEDSYLLSVGAAETAFAGHPGRVVLFGHSHIACHFTLAPGGVEVALAHGGRVALALDPACRYLINPGSVGQPRDRDPRAAFMLYDDATLTVAWRRVDYDIGGAQRRIIEAGLPSVLAERLAAGL